MKSTWHCLTNDKIKLLSKSKEHRKADLWVLFPALQLVRNSDAIYWIFPTAKSWKNAQFTYEHEKNLSLNIILDFCCHIRVHTMQIDTLRNRIRKNKPK